MLDLTVASLNMQVISVGVFFGMIAAWSARWMFIQSVRVSQYVTHKAIVLVIRGYRKFVAKVAEYKSAQKQTSKAA